MDAGFNIYELDDEERKLLESNAPTDTIDELKLAQLNEDVARMKGYLKGRADSDRPAHERLVHDSAKDGTYRKPSSS